MSLIDSPELEYYEEGLPPEREPSPLQRHWIRIAMLVIVVIVGAIVFAELFSQEDFLRGQGAISGQVVDASGKPLALAEIYVSGFDGWGECDNEGRFNLQDLPAGKRTVVVVVTPMPNSFPVFIDLEIPAGETIDMGIITYDTSP